MQQLKPKQVQVSIVIPVCDEEGNLRELSVRVKKVMAGITSSYEIIMVDDGSRDGSFSIMKKLSSGDDRIKIVRLRRNFGKSDALDAGFSKTSGEIIITMDADLQDDPDEIPRFIQEIRKGKDVVSGWRSPRRDRPMKKFLSYFFNRTTSIMTGLKLHDFNCGFKSYRREVINSIKVYGGFHRYLPILANWHGFETGEIKVKHHPRKSGKTKYGFGRITKGFFDLITVMFLTRYNARPLHLFGGAGIILALAGLIINIYITILRLRFGNILNRFPGSQVRRLLVLIGTKD